jgi:hypothetical protein
VRVRAKEKGMRPRLCADAGTGLGDGVADLTWGVSAERGAGETCKEVRCGRLWPEEGSSGSYAGGFVRARAGASKMARMG